MPTDHVTLEEVARIAGVSTSTVSRFLSKKTGVTDTKALAIERAIGLLNYRPNLVARGLALGRTMTVGVMTQEISSPFFNEVMRGAEDGLSERHFAPLFVSGHWDPTEEARRLDMLIGRRVDGIMLMMGNMDDAQVATYADRLPTVLVCRPCSATRVRTIAVDSYLGACSAMAHLLALGHERIAFIAGRPGLIDADARLRAYRECLLKAGLPFDERLVAAGNYACVDGQQAMNELLDRGGPITAVFAANDESAYGAGLALFRRGIKVPDDISLVGFDDMPHSAFSLPPLTSVRQPTYEFGHRAAIALADMIEGRPVSAEPLPSLQLVVRESTRAPRVCSV